MTEPEILASSRATARQARRARRRRWWFVAGVFVVVAATVGALFATGVLGAGDPVDDRRAAPVDDTTTTTDAPAREAAARRRLDSEHPLRLWIAGDSLAGSVGPALGEMTADTGVVQPEYDSRVSSGLFDRGFFDWPEHVGEQLPKIDPEVVVFIMGTNDANVWADRRAAEYRIRTESLMRRLAAKGREVLWVAPPVMRDSDLEDGVQAVDEIARDAADAVHGVTYIDAHTMFADSSGDYQQSFADDQGDRQVMRAGDGVHFSVAGADYLSVHLFRILDQRWHLLAQADLEHPKVVRETEGSTQIPGTHRSVRSSTGSSDSGAGSGSSSRTTTTTRAASTTSTTTTTPPVDPPPSSTPSSTPTTAATTTTTLAGGGSTGSTPP